ncbi:MAG: ATP-binding protein [Calditerrivibrio sp.]|nr:ATP-binding protein [Calditerrivibrio sp.]
MIKQFLKNLNPFELIILISILIFIIISSLMYVDKKSNEKFRSFVYKTQEKTILKLLNKLEEELAQKDLFLNKISSSKSFETKNDLIIISNGGLIFTNITEPLNIDIINYQLKNKVFVTQINNKNYLAIHIKKEDTHYISLVNLDEILSNLLFGENILILNKDGTISYSSEYINFYPEIINKKEKQFSILSGGSEYSVTGASFYNSLDIYIYAPFKYYYSGLMDKELKIGFSALIFGTIILILLFTIKITVNRFIYEKEKYQKLFQLEHEKFQRIVESIDEGVILIDKNYQLLWANSYIVKKLPDIQTGYCYEKITGRQQKCPFCMFEQVFESKKSFSVSTVDFLKGNKGQYEVIWAPLFDEKGDVTACVELVRDISKIKDLEAQLIQAEKLSALGLLAGGVAHEINNPLVGILNISQLLSKRFEEGSKEKELINIIIEAGKETKNIVQNLLDYARQGVEKHEEFDLRESVNFAIKIFGSIIKKKKITINNNLKYPILVKASKGKMHQVFLNLISNSLDALKENGIIELSYEESAQYRSVKIKDTGSGIKKEHLNKIFDPFFTTKEVGKGTGLGLSVTNAIIRDMGWDIKVSSEYGKGTEFEIIIKN